MQRMSGAPVQITNQPLRRLTRLEYEKLGETGVFDNENVELVFGMVVTKPRPSPGHVESTSRIYERLTLALHGRANVRCQMPIAATDDSMPQPDVYVTSSGDWHSHATNAHLVIEVARSSLAFDRNEKSLLYAISEVGEYWIVDLVHELVEVRRDRDAGVWRTISTYRRGQRISPLAFPDVAIDVSEILPPSA